MGVDFGRHLRWAFARPGYPGGWVGGGRQVKGGYMGGVAFAGTRGELSSVCIVSGLDCIVFALSRQRANP